MPHSFARALGALGSWAVVIQMLHAFRQKVDQVILSRSQVRSRLPAATLLPRLDRELAAVDPRWPLLRAEPLEAKPLRQQQPQRLASALLGTALLAAWLPAMRAARLQPAEALRLE